MVSGGLLLTIGLWIFRPFSLPFSGGALFLATYLLIVGIPFDTVFSGFTQTAIWTLIAASFFGFVLEKSGLGRRIAYAVVRRLRPTYPFMILAWVLIGMALSVLTPSITVRVAIVIPIAAQMCGLFHLEKYSKGNSLIMLSAFSMAILPGSAWFSGSLWGPIISGLYQSIPEMDGLLTPQNWNAVMMVPMLLVSLILAVGSYFVLKPSDALSEQAITKLKNQPSTPMSRQEKAAAIILILSFLLFSTSKFHGIPDVAVCLGAIVLFYLSGVMNVEDFSSGISWDLAIFIGISLSLGAIFAETGVSAWLSAVIVPALAPVATNPWLFLSLFTLALFLWRFLDVAILIPTMAILIPILPAVYEAYSISPLVWVAVFVMTGNCFFMNYQNMWANMSLSIAGDRAWTPGHLLRFSLLYFAACILSLSAAIPLWRGEGFL